MPLTLTVHQTEAAVPLLTSIVIGEASSVLRLD